MCWQCGHSSEQKEIKKRLKAFARNLANKDSIIGAISLIPTGREGMEIGIRWCVLKNSVVKSQHSFAPQQALHCAVTATLHFFFFLSCVNKSKLDTWLVQSVSVSGPFNSSISRTKKNFLKKKRTKREKEKERFLLIMED